MRNAFLTVALLAALVAVPTVNADIFLNDLNTSVRFSQDQNGQITGMDDWTVDGTDHLYTQWFWFRVGSTGPESSLAALTQTINLAASRRLDLTLVDPAGRFEIDVRYDLIGGTAGSGLSKIGEQIRIRNTGATSLDFHFFQYSDFDLNGTIGDDTVFIDGFNTARVWDGGGVVLNETIVTPAANRREAGIFADTVSKLNDANPDDLNNVGGPLAGDVTWAFQWDSVIGVGGSMLISKVKSIQAIPAPGAALLGVMGMGLVGYIKRRFA